MWHLASGSSASLGLHLKRFLEAFHYSNHVPFFLACPSCLSNSLVISLSSVAGTQYQRKGWPPPSLGLKWAFASWKKKKKEDDIYQAILERRHYLGGTPVSEFSLVLFLPSVLSTWREILQNRRHARCSQEWRMCVNSSLSSSDVHITDSGAFSAELQ